MVDQSKLELYLFHPNEMRRVCIAVDTIGLRGFLEIFRQAKIIGLIYFWIYNEKSVDTTNLYLYTHTPTEISEMLKVSFAHAQYQRKYLKWRKS